MLDVTGCTTKNPSTITCWEGGDLCNIITSFRFQIISFSSFGFIRGSDMWIPIFKQMAVLMQSPFSRCCHGYRYLGFRLLLTRAWLHVNDFNEVAIKQRYWVILLLNSELFWKFYKIWLCINASSLFQKFANWFSSLKIMFRISSRLKFSWCID